MDCIIRIIKGPEEGQQFHCTGTEAVVGRSPRSQVRLGSPSVSYEHAVISRIGDDFFIENLSATGTFVNEERITGKVRLRAKDRLRFGADTIGRVDAVPTSGKAGGSRRLLIVAVISAVAVIAILAFSDFFKAPATHFNDRAAFAKIEPWTQEKVREKVFTPEVYVMLREAWRLRQSGDPAASAKLWQKLQIVLASEEAQLGYQALADKDPNKVTLQHLASSDPKYANPNDDEMGVSLVQFVAIMAH